MVLKYKQKTNSFHLRSAMEPDGAEWREHKTKPNVYITTDIKAAARFHRYGTAKTKIFFNNVKPKLYDIATPALPKILDAHQKEGVKFILSRQSSYLAHAPGAGKTVQAIIASEMIEVAGQTIIIAPPGLMLNWERELDKFTFEWRSVSIVPTSINAERVAWKSDYILVPFSMLTKDWVLKKLLKIKKKMVIVDEASGFKDYNAKRSQVLYDKILKLSEVPYIVMLDGSPTPNKYMDLWAPNYFLCPHGISFMTQIEFGLRFCGAKQGFRGKWEFKGSNNADELHRRMHKYFFNTVTEDKLEHSERLRSIAYITNKALPAELRIWESHFGKDVSISDFIDTDNKGELSKWRYRIGMSKVKYAVKYIIDRLEAGSESIGVYAWHREVCLALAEGLKKYKPGLVMGGTKPLEREHIFKEFNAGKKRLLVGNISAISRGHNLQRGDRAIFVEFSYSDEENKQVEKRFSRRGRDKTKPVRSEYLVVANSLDEAVLNIVLRKEKNTRKVIR
jgi:SNF2 family DNA or RNA helicase